MAAATYWRVDVQVLRSAQAVERQPAELVVHARRVASGAFGWQPERAAAQAMLERELQKHPSSHYLRRSVEHVAKARRSFSPFWKLAGLAGFFIFVLSVLVAIASAGKKRAWLALSAVVSFAVFAMGMGLL